MREQESKVMSVADRLTENMEKVILGKREMIEKVVIAFLSRGHVLLEDVPGSGKTMLAKALSVSVDGVFKRVQMTPDLLPADLTGVNIYHPKKEAFQFMPGPVFANVLIADEINRATPKTQAGLLECMEEGQVTIDYQTYILEKPFFVIATENPVDSMGVFPLPEAQLDRFMMKLSMSYPEHEALVDVLKKHMNPDVLQELRPVVTLDEVKEAMQEADEVFVSDDLVEYVARILEQSRREEAVLLGISQRGGIRLLQCAKTVAAIRGRNYVLPDDIKYVAVDVLAHRLVLHTRERGQEGRARAVMEKILKQVPVPTEEELG